MDKQAGPVERADPARRSSTGLLDRPPVHKSGWLGPVLVAAGLLLSAILVWWFAVGRNASAPPAGHAAAAAGQPVGAATVATGALPVTLSGLGTVTPLATITVQTQINGQLLSVGFHEGQIVQKGDFLAQIDPRPYQAAVEQDQGTLAHDTGLLHQAISDLARYKLLLAQHSIAMQQEADQEYLVEQDRGTVLADQGILATAQVNLLYCHIVAPVTGRVGLRLVDPGNYVQTTSTTGLVVLTQLQPISVIFVLPEDDLAAVWRQLRAGRTLSVTAFNRTDQTAIATGMLDSVDNEVDTTTGTVKLRANFPNTDQALFPNEFVNAELLVDTLNDVVVAPVAAIQHGAPGDFVYQIKPDKTVGVTVVKTGVTSEDRVQILSGLKAGDMVVVDGADRLRDGAKVRVTADSSNPSSSVNPGPGAPPGQEPAPATPKVPGQHGHHRKPAATDASPNAQAPGGQ
nr:efflux RND transporter periplasmic adaptor subunit [uncultured Lichenicoccus sp.]